MSAFDVKKYDGIMIDTVRLKGRFLSADLHCIIRKQLDTILKYSGEDLMFMFTSGDLLGSWDNRISFKIKDKEWAYDADLGRALQFDCMEYFELEFSLHKFFEGHNCFGGNCDLATLHSVYDFLETTFGIQFINRDSMELLRIDLAEIYDMPSKEYKSAMFDDLKNMRKYKTKPSTYKNTGLYWNGSTTTFKIYDKHAEFYKHDYKKLKRSDRVKADSILAQTVNYIRLECEIHKRKLDDLFDKNLKVENIMSNIIKIQDVYLLEKQRILSNPTDETKMVVADVYEVLSQNFTSAKASAILGFWTNITTRGEEWARENYPSATFYRHRKTLRDLNISIYENTSLTSPKSDI